MRAETPELREELRLIDAKEKAKREKIEKYWQSTAKLIKKYDIKTNFWDTKCNKAIPLHPNQISDELYKKIKQNGDEDLYDDVWLWLGHCYRRGYPFHSIN